MLSARIYKFVFLLGVILAVSAPGLTWAAEETVVELNPICWQEQDCQSFFNKKYGSDDKRKGSWLPQDGECDKPDWGKCLAVGPVKLAVAIGEVTQINDLAQYIVVIYNYAMMIAGIVATIVIIISGVQWVASGGSSEVIGSAKKRITGALVGLLITYLSYAILNTLNPNFVNITTPQAFMVRPIVIPPEYCVDWERAENMLFAYAGVNGAIPRKAGGGDIFDKNLNDVQDRLCGDQFYASGGSNLLCVSSNCAYNSKGKICSKKEMQNSPGKNEYECSNAVIRGVVMGRYILPTGCVAGIKGFEYPPLSREPDTGLLAIFYDKDTGLYKVNHHGGIGTMYETTGDDDNILVIAPDDEMEKKGVQYYKIEFSDDTLENFISQNQNNGLVGFVVMLAFDDACGADETHMISKTGRDLGHKESILRSLNDIKLSVNDYFTPEELKRGVVLNIDVTAITPD